MALTKISTGMLKQDAASSDLNIDAGTLYLDVSNNRVGIANTSPAYTLDVSAGSAIAARFTGGDSNGITSIFTRASEQGLKTWSGNSYYSGIVAGAHFQIFTNNSPATPRVTVLDAGNVGIGTTSPNNKLEISGGNIRIINHSTGRITFNNGSTEAFFGFNGAGSSTLDSGALPLQVQTQGSNHIRFDTNSTERMRIDSSGRVGVGVTPKSWLTSVDVIDVGTSAAAYYSGGVTHNAYFDNTNNRWEYKGTGAATFYNIQGGTHIWSYAAAGTANNPITFNEAMRIDSSGRVGIGTAAPNGNGQLTINSAADNSPQIVFSENDTQKWLIGHRHDGDHFRFYDLANSAERMRIDGAGRVLIGTTDTSPWNNTGTDTGIMLSYDGWIAAAASSQAPLELNRMSNDGNIINLRKDGAIRGRIANDSTSLVVTGSSTGLKFGSAAIWPTTGGGVTNSNGAKDLGASTVKFKDLYLNGYAYVGALKTNASVESVSNLTFWVANVGEAARIEQGTGNIGVGTSAPSFSAVNSVSSGIKGIEIFKNGTDTASAIKLAGDNGSGTKAFAQIGYSGANATAHFANFNTSGTQVGEIVIGSTGNVGIGTTSPSEKLEVAGTALVENAKLKAIAESNTDTAVDVFVYDTRKDSDGGAWRKRTQNTSWYNETLNTSTRGSRREFPCVAVIVALGSSGNNVTIYDGDDPSLPMWMQFTLLNQDQVSISAMNGTVCLGNNYTANSGFGGNGLVLFEFAADRSRHALSNGSNPSYDPERFGVISGNQSVSSIWPKYSSPNDRYYTLVNYSVNDVTMTVLPNAPIDGDTGLPMPTIAVATEGGVSVIKDDGNVYDSSDGSVYGSIEFIDERIISDRQTSDTRYFISQKVSSIVNDGWSTYEYYTGDFSTGYPRLLSDSGSSIIKKAKDHSVRGADKGLSFWDWKESDNDSSQGAYFNKSLMAFVASNYNTGWMHGDIKLATLSDTDTTNVTAGTQPDRSYNNNALSVSGTVTKTAVATGADLVAYSGFSSNNYLQQPYNADLQFGTGDFSIACWVKAGTNESYRRFISIQDPSGQQGNNDAINIKYAPYSSNGQIYAYLGATEGVITTPDNQAANVWHQLILTRKSSTYYLYFNGTLVDSTPSTQSKGGTSHVLRIGSGAEGGEIFSDGSIALVRISKTAPSEEQIKKMYNDEKHLFAPNAKATLYGSSDAVTALAYDDDTELLHAGTSAGRSVFQGLNRVDNTTDAVGAAISASNGFIVEE